MAKEHVIPEACSLHIGEGGVKRSRLEASYGEGTHGPKPLISLHNGEGG